MQLQYATRSEGLKHVAYTITYTKLNIATERAETCLINVQLGLAWFRLQALLNTCEKRLLALLCPSVVHMEQHFPNPVSSGLCWRRTREFREPWVVSILEYQNTLHRISQNKVFRIVRNFNALAQGSRQRTDKLTQRCHWTHPRPHCGPKHFKIYDTFNKYATEKKFEK